MRLRHIPVLVDEVMTLLQCASHQTVVDGTLGGGGHTMEILRRTAPDGIVIGLEWDEDALTEARCLLEPLGERVKMFRENFVHLPDRLSAMNIGSVDGILLDLGLSSFQLEKRQRGFSLKGEGPLDMRMDQRTDVTAADLVNGLSEKELEETLLLYGEERWAKRIARAMVAERNREPIQTTERLRSVVCRAIPPRFRQYRIDPATRTFQALRIHVNHELDNLRQILKTGWKLLRTGGRMCVISFHSLEDRIVKEAFRTLAQENVDGLRRAPLMRVITKKPVTPSEEEKERNPRSRSAKLRCAERV
jgi:16S rRNA (cytosine1402-N4)-methyltransferase